MPDLDSLRRDGEAAIAAAGSAAEVEELRVRYLGPQGRADADPARHRRAPADQRGPVGKQANEVRQALEALLDERAACAARTGAAARLPGGPHRRDAARRPAAAAPALST